MERDLSCMQATIRAMEKKVETTRYEFLWNTFFFFLLIANYSPQQFSFAILNCNCKLPFLQNSREAEAAFHRFVVALKKHWTE